MRDGDTRNAALIGDRQTPDVTEYKTVKLIEMYFRNIYIYVSLIFFYFSDLLLKNVVKDWSKLLRVLWKLSCQQNYNEEVEYLIIIKGPEGDKCLTLQ